MTHIGCALDDPQRAVAIGTVRGWRLILASLRDDGGATDAVLNEVENCTACLRALVWWLSGSTSSAFVDLAHGSRQAAINQAEKLLGEAIDAAGNA